MFKLRLWALVLLITLVSVSFCSAEQTENNTTSSTLVWEGTWIDGENTLVLTQDENSVIGTYDDAIYSATILIEGTVSEDGKVLSGVWTEPGMFTFTLSDDGTFFNGTAGLGSEYTIEGETDNWNGTLTTEMNTENLWDGTWITGMGAIQNMTQNGESVCGTYNGVNGEYQELEGNVTEDGKVLSGEWIGYGEYTFTLSDDGNVFNGTYGQGSNDTMEDGTDDSWNGTRVELQI